MIDFAHRSPVFSEFSFMLSAAHTITKPQVIVPLTTSRDTAML